MFDMFNLWQGTQKKLITWESFRRAQDASYARCANGCDAPGKFRTLDNRDLCDTCYQVIAADEQRRIYEAP